MSSLSYFVNVNVYFFILLFSLSIILGGLYLVWRITDPSKLKNNKPEEEEESEEEEEEEEEEEVEEEVRRDRRGLRRMQVRRRNAPPREAGRPAERDAPRAAGEEDNEENEIGEEEDEEVQRQQTPNQAQLPKKIGKKKAQKLQDKEDRARMREAMLEEKERRKKQEDREIEERKKKQKEEKEKEKEIEEELERLREERKRKEEEEYKQLKESFSVEDAGSVKEEIDNFEKNLEEFINYIKETKVVFIEDLAAKYNIEPKVIVQKIEGLESEGKLSGIIDERGKFIYLTTQELTNIAKFIKQRGKVSISDISRESNRLVDLNPKLKIVEPQESTEAE